MLYLSENNWISWSYGKERFARSSSPDDKFIVHHNPSPKPIQTLMYEAERAARSVADHYPNRKIDLFLSGGVDSEIMVKAFVNAKLNPNVYVVRYENDINIKDVSYAVALANDIGIDIKIIDMNLKKFFENDAEIIADQAQMDRPRMLPHLKFGDYVDGLSIIAMGDALWQRTNDDYSKQGTWEAWEIETDYACDKYNIFHNRESIHLWYHWTPELLLAHTKWNWFKKLISDGYPGKLGNSSTKMDGLREEFPNIWNRKKSTGFEQIDHIITEFENFLSVKNNGLIYRQQIEYNIDDYFVRLTGKKFS